MRLSRRLVGMVGLGALVVAMAGGVTWAAFTATTVNSGDEVRSGTVKLEDNDNDSAVLALSAAEPGAADSGCITVTFNGSLASTVRLYGTTSGSGLDQYLELKVTRGSYSPTDPGFDSCTNFQPDATDYLGLGAGVVYEGTLQGYADAYAGGIADPPSGGPESWTNGESHVYQLEISLRHNLAAQGLNAAQEFTWEARNQ
jgi:predicted ribosomally synthesized peptide with SipW-like signal peptide